MAEKGYHSINNEPVPQAGYQQGYPQGYPQSYQQGYPQGLGYPQGPPAGPPQAPPSYDVSMTGGASKFISKLVYIEILYTFLMYTINLFQKLTSFSNSES